MILIESLLLTTLLCVCGYATYTDFKTGLIPNKALLISVSAVLVLDILYYSLFQRELVGGFLLNFAVNTFLSILLYAYSFWGAGDSKLMILAGIAVPARFYASNIFSLPIITITVQTFAIAFTYLVIESIILGIIRRDFFMSSKKFTISSLKRIIGSYLLSYTYILLFSFIIRLISSDYLESSSYIVPLCNFFIVFTILNFNFFKKIYVVGSVLMADIILMVIFRSTLPSVIPPVWNLLIIAIVLAFRFLAEKYNYKSISASDAAQGMILSFETILRFNSSKIKGLPLMTTEDFRSRISADEAESIKKWAGTQKTSSEITIVRKLPFAIFISIGVITFLGLRMWIIC